ncbi:hypothetical protein CK203_085602 [Vitis vinifera]|uniref:Uncharacterized protein n=1 Tax=Vitis vinifera TaxID=29760 RepID=A0A438BWK4_VITVI|nr:hypothetical protein CK203_085602 [Vitis vinifera]
MLRLKDKSLSGRSLGLRGRIQHLEFKFAHVSLEDQPTNALTNRYITVALFLSRPRLKFLIGAPFCKGVLAKDNVHP